MKVRKRMIIMKVIKVGEDDDAERDDEEVRTEEIMKVREIMQAKKMMVRI